MEFGLNFFPTESPDETPAGDYFTECLDLAAQADELGYDHVRIVEHHFHRYGGYSPNPLVFLAAAAQRTRDVRLITGAVLPAFIHPLRLAGEVGMVDALSGGRLEVGFGRAFLPGEFARFGVSLDESRARFEEGITTVARLLEEEDVTSDGPFHPFPESTTLPRPTQSPRPPFWVAAVGNPTSFGRAGEMGHGVMAIPLAGPMMKGMLDVYREAWASAGHPGAGRVMLAFHMYCEEEATRPARWRAARSSTTCTRWPTRRPTGWAARRRRTTRATTCCSSRSRPRRSRGPWPRAAPGWARPTRSSSRPSPTTSRRTASRWRRCR